MTEPTKTPLVGAPQAAAGEPDKANGTAMVTVGCKLPNGLIMELGKVGDDDYQTVRLNGGNDANIIGGYGLTAVSKSFWDAWMKRNHKLGFVKRAMVFVHGDIASARDHAQDNAGIRTGFEAIDPEKKILGVDGKPLLETDMTHLNEGRAQVAQFQQRQRAAQQAASVR